MTTCGSILFTQQETPARMHLPVCRSLAALETFARALAPYTTAAIEEVSLTQIVEMTDLPQAASNLTAIKEQAMLLLHGEAGKTQTKRLALPAPKEVFVTIGQDILVNPAKGDILAHAYSELTGETFTFVRGRRQ
jgi:hypothetical protein